MQYAPRKYVVSSFSSRMLVNIASLLILCVHVLLEILSLGMGEFQSDIVP